MTAYRPSDGGEFSVHAHTSTSSAAATVVITLAGEMDSASAPEVEHVMEDVLEQHRPQRICLDMQEATFLDSSGIRTLLVCHQRARDRRCELEISRAHDNVRQVLSITSLLETFGLQDEGPPQAQW